MLYLSPPFFLSLDFTASDRQNAENNRQESYPIDHISGNRTRMSCRCAFSTLRLFVRSLTRLELEPINRMPSLPFASGSRRYGSKEGARTRASKTTATLWKNKKSDEEIFRPRKGKCKDAKIVTGNKFASDKAAKDVYNSLSKASPKSPTPIPSSWDSNNVVDYSSDAVEALAAEFKQGLESARPEEESFGPSYRPLESESFKSAGNRRPSPDTTRKLWRETSERRVRLDNPTDQRFSSMGEGSFKDKSSSSFKPRLRERYISKEREHWMIDKEALKQKLGSSPWLPQKRLSPDALAGIRAIHAQYPTEFTTSTLAEKFQISPEAIRRILKSKWQPNVDEESDRQERWWKRGESVWKRWSETGVKPPKKWRDAGVQTGMGIGDRRRAMRDETGGVSGRAWKKGGVIAAPGESWKDEGQHIPITTEKRVTMDRRKPSGSYV